MITLVACSHGTRFNSGRTEIAAIRRKLAAAVPAAHVVEAFVDVESPEVAAVVAVAADKGPVVVVPLLLSTGFHTSVDIAGSVAPFAHAAAANPLGPHELLANGLRDRVEAAVAETGYRGGDHVVLAAAGSSDPAAASAVKRTRDLLSPFLPCPISIGYGAGASPSIPQAVEEARAAGARRVIAASYVLAPGHFANLVTTAGADIVTQPLGAHDGVISVAVERFYEAALRFHPSFDRCPA